MIDEWKGFGRFKKRSGVVIAMTLKVRENYPHMMNLHRLSYATTTSSTIENLPQ
jgi:hypothetical protein